MQQARTRPGERHSRRGRAWQQRRARLQSSRKSASSTVLCMTCYPAAAVELCVHALVCNTSCTARAFACTRQVEAANAEVERSNQARQSDFSGAAERLRKLSTAEYEARGPLFASCSISNAASNQCIAVALEQTGTMHY